MIQDRINDSIHVARRFINRMYDICFSARFLNLIRIRCIDNNLSIVAASIGVKLNIILDIAYIE